MNVIFGEGDSDGLEKAYHILGLPYVFGVCLVLEEVCGRIITIDSFLDNAVSKVWRFEDLDQDGHVEDVAFKSKEIGKEDWIYGFLEKLFVLLFALRVSVFMNELIELLMSGKEELIFGVKFPVDILEYFTTLILFSLDVWFQPFYNGLYSIIG